MKIKTTVAALALSASSSSFALMAPPTQTKTICLEVYETAEGVSYSSGCDASSNNVELGLTILENGCAVDQVALIAHKYGRRFDIQISSCLPPNVAQL